jgi:four helix bundle protein
MQGAAGADDTAVRFGVGHEQLPFFRSGTSVASNYRAACRGRSKAEFIAKMGIVEEEADETLFWLEVIEEVEIFKKDSILSLMQECNEILSIVVSSINTARKRK